MGSKGGWVQGTDLIPLATGAMVAKRWADRGWNTPWSKASPKLYGPVGTMRAMRKSLRTRTRGKKRQFRRRFRGRRRRTAVPLRMYRRLRTVTYWSADLAAGGALSQTFLKLNSIYDPTGNIGISQPYAHDELALLYNRYQVVKYNVKIEWVSSDNTNPLVVGFTALPESTSLTAYAHYMEIPGTVSRMCTMDVDKTMLFKSGGVNSQLSTTRLPDDVLQADMGNDPTRVLYGHVWAQAVDAATDAGRVTAVITLTQTVKLFDPKTLSRS